METEPLPTDAAPRDESPAAPAAAAATRTPEAAEEALNAAVDAEQVVASGKMDDDTVIIADPDRAASPFAVPEVHGPSEDDDAEEDLRCRRYDDDDDEDDAEEEEDIARSQRQDRVVSEERHSEGATDEPAPAATQGADSSTEDGSDSDGAVAAPARGLAQWVGRALGFLEGSPVVRGVLRAAWVPLVIGLGVATVRPGITLLDALAPINFRDRTAV